jgi:hypothetical protein
VKFFVKHPETRQAARESTFLAAHKTEERAKAEERHETMELASSASLTVLMMDQPTTAPRMAALRGLSPSRLARRMNDAVLCPVGTAEPIAGASILVVDSKPFDIHDYSEDVVPGGEADGERTAPVGLIFYGEGSRPREPHDIRSPRNARSAAAHITSKATLPLNGSAAAAGSSASPGSSKTAFALAKPVKRVKITGAAAGGVSPQRGPTPGADAGPARVRSYQQRQQLLRAKEQMEEQRRRSERLATSVARALKSPTAAPGTASAASTAAAASLGLQNPFRMAPERVDLPFL